MTDPTKEQILRWVETWKQANVALKKIKKQELQAFDYSANQVLVDAMLQIAYEHRRPKATSGLVEQQRFFMKLRSMKPPLRDFGDKEVDR